MKKKNSFYSLKDNLKLFKLYRLYLLFSILQDKVSCGFKDNKYNMYNKYNLGSKTSCFVLSFHSLAVPLNKACCIRKYKENMGFL